MNTLNVVNLKCGGCEKSVTSKLTKLGFKNVKVDSNNQIISFDGNTDIAKKELTKMGYPPADSKQAKSLLKKTKSYLSCMIGKSKK